MKKRIVVVVMLLICFLTSACGSKQANNTKAANADNKVNEQKNTVPSANEKGYEKYTGTWVMEKCLVDDFIYGIGVSIKSDKDGNVTGVIGDAAENAAHISNVDIKGRIENDELNCRFDEDGWGHSGTIKIEFKGDKINLTMKYTASKDKNSMWGIGEGSFELINENTKVKRTLSNLKDGGLQVIDSQSFNVSFEKFGNVKFISGIKRENCNTEVNFYLIDNNENVLYKFPAFYGNKKGMFNDIAAVSFADVNGDGLKDVIIIADFALASKKTATAGIYIQKDNEFISSDDLDEKINSSAGEKKISSVIKIAKEYLKK